MFSSRERVEEAGFQGFVSIGELLKGECEAIPDAPGVYLIIRDSGVFPTFLDENPSGWQKGRSPTMDIERLAEHWVEESVVLYIGKAGSMAGAATLQSRLRKYFRGGISTATSHWGGRFIWQLQDSMELLVCWKPTPDNDSRVLEGKLIDQFLKAYGKRPFANLKN